MNKSPWRLEEVDGRPWRLEEVDDGDEQYPVESRFAVRHTSPDQQDPSFDRRRSVSSVLRYARPLPMNRVPFRTWPVEHKDISFILRYARPRFHRLIRPSPPDEHDAFRCLPMTMMMMQFLRFDPAMYTSPGRTYARVGVRDPARMYVRGRIYFLAHWPLYVRVHATCAPLLRHVCASTSTSMYVHVRDQNDNATYASTRWVPTVKHFLACKDVAGGSQQSGGESFFLFLPGRTSLSAKM